MKNIITLIALLTSIATVSAQSLVWESRSISDEAAVPTASKFMDPSGKVQVGLDWNVVTDGGSFVSMGGSDYISYEAGTNGRHSGFLNMGFNNDAEDQDDYLELTISFSPAVAGLQFALLDVDEADDFEFDTNRHWQDVVSVHYNGTNNATGMVSSMGSCVAYDDESYIDGFEGIESGACGNDGVPSGDESANINFDFGTTFVSSITIRYMSGNDLAWTNNPDGQMIGISDFSWGTVLPISLVDFSLEEINSEVSIAWEVAEQENNDYYVIEHSTDGMYYENIHIRAGEGTTSASHTYTFTHKTPANGVNYYRLVQYDLDGNSQTFEVKAIEIEAAISLELVNTIATNGLSLLGSGEVAYDYTIFDISGQATSISGRTSDTGSAQIDVSNLAQGQYIIFLQNENGQQVAHRFVKA